MEILWCSGALFAEWCPVEPQRFKSEYNGSARNFHYNIKMINLYYNHHHHHHLYTVFTITYLKQAMLLAQTIWQLFCNYVHGTTIAAAHTTTTTTSSITRNFTLNIFKLYLTMFTKF